MQVSSERVRARNDKPIGEGPVVYWMQRDQRAEDNWALLYAVEQAQERSVPVVVVFNLVDSFGEATLRHYDFMFRGLAETQTALTKLGIPFVLTQGEVTDALCDFFSTHTVGEVVTDFNPLRFTDKWRKVVAEAIPVRLTEVDAHNVVPCWIASPKAEFAAHTFRPKLHKLLPEWLVAIPSIPDCSALNKHSDIKPSQVQFETLLEDVASNHSVPAVDTYTPGAKAGLAELSDFLSNKLNEYPEARNNPNESALSNLSPYLHFGQISAQRVAMAVETKRGVSREAKEVFLEELLVRRELTDNYCFYTEAYDTIAGAHEWAQKTLREHKSDKREYLYTRDEFEQAQTHDELWNAMQLQMQTEGKMHGWCRMYWAKKILEWTPDPQTAIDYALFLNDRYELDGNDPNGVVGVMWSIAGVHDRAWTERPVFGKIRYMNFNGAKRKFNVKAYIEKYAPTAKLFDEQNA